MRQRLVEDDEWFVEVEKAVFPNDEEKEKLIEELLQEIKVGGAFGTILLVSLVCGRIQTGRF